MDLSPPIYWFGGYPAPRIPMAGDADGDGRADFVGLYPADEGILDLIRTSELGKPCDNVQARRPFGAGAVAVACADCDGKPGVEVVVVLPDGAVRIACDLDPKSRLYRRDEPVATLRPELRPAAPGRTVTDDFNTDGKVDILVVDANGGLLWLRNQGVVGDAVRFTPIRVEGSLADARRVAAGDLDGDGCAELVWLTKEGFVRRAVIGKSRLGGPALVQVRTLARASGDDGLAVGRFDGDARADVIVGNRLLPGGDAAQAYTAPNLPSAEVARSDVVWAAGDFNGDGLDDLLRARRSDERFVGDDVLLQITHREGEPASFQDTDNDSLRDDWETGKVKPGGLDLPALGCSPRHADVIVEVQPFEGVSDQVLHKEMDRVIAYYAALPIANPDGQPGMGLRVIYREPIPKSREGEHWGNLAGEFHPASHRGVTHWMLIGTGGGGQSSEMADAGSCGAAALYATFIHEFGHQIGLDHSGHWPAWCPAYPSLMNYSYSYQLGGDGNRIGYSAGLLAGMTIDERSLDEYLPVPPAAVDFLSGPPYRFKIQPAPDGKGTLVDWNWNGIFGEKGYSADINYGYSTYAGDRRHIGKTLSAPALVAHGEGDGARLLMFATGHPADAAPAAPAPNLRLYLRVWQGKDPAAEGDKWSDEMEVAALGVAGDPSAAYLGGATWVSYATAEGVRACRVTLAEDGKATVGPPQLVPDSAGAQPTLVPFAGRLALLLWRGADAPLAFRAAAPNGDALNLLPEQALPLKSRVPVGVAAGPDQDGRSSLWIGLTEDQDAKRPTRWQVRRLLSRGDGMWEEVAREWVGGEGAQHRGQERVILLSEPSPDFPDGQLYFLQCGMFGGDPPSSCIYTGIRVKNQDVHGGWLVRRYNDEWSTSRSGPGACFFRGEIAYAMRWNAPRGHESEDNLLIGFFGRGIDRAPMGDFDDIGFIREVGLTHSIACVAN